MKGIVKTENFVTFVESRLQKEHSQIRSSSFFQRLTHTMRDITLAAYGSLPKWTMLMTTDRIAAVTKQHGIHVRDSEFSISILGKQSFI